MAFPPPKPPSTNFVPDQAMHVKIKSGPKYTGDGLIVAQVIPSDDDNVVIAYPTAKTLLPVHVAALRVVVVPDARAVQLSPSGEVNIVPDAPTATSWEPALMTAFKVFVVPEVCEVQVTPLGEVRIVPDAPTATNKEPDQAMPNKGVVAPDVAGSQ